MLFFQSEKLLQHQFRRFAAAVYESENFEKSVEEDFLYKSTSIVGENHSYDPYLIDYNEDTNTFTYNDPWIRTDPTNDSCCNVSESNVSVEGKENHTTPTLVPIAHALTETTSKSEVEGCDHIRGDHESNTTESRNQIGNCDVAAEHVPKVSFPKIMNNRR